jgi:hypothetical protein
MTDPKARGGLVPTLLVALFVLFVVVPTVVSVETGDGPICFSDSGCPLSAVNPCRRTPSFAVIGRCAVALR